MFILRFSFENHKSFRDEVDLTLVRRSLQTVVPKEGSWVDHTHRLAGIYGPNASGKSSVLDALNFMRNVVRHSAGSWAERKSLPRAPFALDDVSMRRPSTFILDFVLEDVRYEYGFSLTQEAVVEEWLYTFPTGRKRVMFERDASAGGLVFGRELKGGESALAKATGQRELVLSKGALFKNEQLLEIYHAITTHIIFARFDEMDRQGRLKAVVSDVADGTLSLDDLAIMLKVADVGIAGAELSEEESPAELRTLLRKIFEVGAQSAKAEAKPSKAASEELTLPSMDEEAFARFLAEAERGLKFRHLGEAGKTYQLATSVQSTGTLSWLSLAAPALRILRIGGVFAVDEVDASLHPQLAQVLIQMFRDERVNARGSQLLFTTHDAYFLSPLSEVQLQPEEVWLVEKGRNGVSELFSIGDFPTRSGDNLSRKYLQGRYGGVPSVAPSFFESLAAGQDVTHERSTKELAANGSASPRI